MQVKKPRRIGRTFAIVAALLVGIVGAGYFYLSASGTASHDRDFALQIAKLTKAQILSLSPLRPHINCISRKRS